MKQWLWLLVGLMGLSCVAKESLDYVDPMIGTEGVGSEYGGMTPMTGVPFGSMHLIPVTRTNGIGRTSFNALDRRLLGFVLSRQPAIWMGEWGAVRIALKEPLDIEEIKATPYLTVVKAGGYTYELTASAHAAFIRSDDPSLGDTLPMEGSTSERSERTSSQPMPNFRCHYVCARTNGELKVALSLISAAEAKRSLAEELPAAFDAAVALVRAQWRKYFARVIIDADESVKTIFYTGLYHSLLYPREITERGRRYSAMDDKIHEGVGYTCFSLWDTYRSEHALLTLFAPDRVGGMMQSLVDMYREGGWLPIWPNPGYTGQMVGGPAEVVLAEAYIKGIRDFDVEGAYAAARHNAMVPQQGDLERRWTGTWGDPPGPPETRSGLTRYLERGYVSADETADSVSRTLDYAYDDHALYCFAKALGHNKDAAIFAARSKNYTNLWNQAALRFHARRLDGTFLDPASKEWRCDAYVETDQDSARWCVPHDVAGLVKLMGGKAEFLKELDRFFDKDFFKPDVVGNKSVHGNETCHHLAYLYNRVGEYESTQRRVHDILTKCYSTDRRGFDGNEDCGQMSSWYVLSALGFYPLDPASGYYELGSPVVRSAELRFGAPYADSELKITVRNYSPLRWRVKRVVLNGREVKDNRLAHAEIVAGGELVFEME